MDYLWTLVVILISASRFEVLALEFIITSHPMNATICQGSEVEFNCGYFIRGTATDIPPSWEIKGNSFTRTITRANIDNNPGFQWIVDGDDTNTTRLLVGPVDERYVGRTTFQCQGFVGSEVSSNTATLTVIGTPPSPNITVTHVGMNTFTISWTIPEYDPGRVCGPVMYRVTISGPDLNNVTTPDANMNTFTGLTPNTNYNITITPYSNAGDGTSDSKVVMTMPTVPNPPTDIQLNLRFDNEIPSINASWTAPHLEPTMTEVEQYNLTLYINGLLQATTNVPGDTTMVDIFTVFGQNITRERYTNYSLSVAAINSAGMGKFNESDVLIARYIQGDEPTSGVGMITISCTTAPSEPPVNCIATYICRNETEEIVISNLDVPFILKTTQPCNITIKVVLGKETLEQETYTNVVPDDELTIVTATTTIVTPGPTSTMPPNQPSRSADDDDDTGTIVAIIIGVLAFVGLIVLIILCMCWCRYRKRRKLALIPCAIKCTCCTCLLCTYCAKKRRGSMKPMTTGNDKTDTGNSNSSGDSRDSPNSADAFVMKENTQPEAGYCEVAPQKKVKHDNGITSEYSVVGSEGNPTKNAFQPVALYSEVEPVPKKNGLVPATSVPSQYSVITQEEDTDTNNTVEGMPMYSEVDKSKKTIKVQQLPEYSIVHKPTKAEGKADNYSDLADIGPYPTKRPPQDKVQYTEVTPSNATPSDSGTQYTNVDHINDGPIHLSTDHKVQYSVVQ